MSLPIYLCTNKSTTGDSLIVDILAAYQERIPPVLHVNITGAVNYSVLGSHDMALWQTYYTGTGDVAKDLVVGVRFWKITVNSISGTIAASVGPVPDQGGHNVLPAVVTSTGYSV